MNNCTNPQAPNTTVPHLMPYILLKDRAMTDMLGKYLKIEKKIPTKTNFNFLQKQINLIYLHWPPLALRNGKQMLLISVCQQSMLIWIQFEISTIIYHFIDETLKSSCPIRAIASMSCLKIHLGTFLIYLY